MFFEGNGGHFAQIQDFGDEVHFEIIEDQRVVAQNLRILLDFIDVERVLANFKIEYFMRAGD